MKPKPEPDVNPKEQEKRKELLNAYKRVAATEDGQTVFRHMVELFGWKAQLLAVNPQTQEISPTSTVNNVAIRDAWGLVRRFIPWNSLNAIEAERKPEHADKQTEAKH